MIRKNSEPKKNEKKKKFDAQAKKKQLNFKFVWHKL